MPPPPPDPERVRQAWELSGEGFTCRQVADQMGISLGTASAWIRQGREAEKWVELLDKAEERMRMATRLEFYRGWLIAEAKTSGMSAKDAIPVLLKVEERLAKLGGLDAPTQVNITDGPQPSVDPRVIAQVREAQRRAAADEQALLNGNSDGHIDPRAITNGDEP